MYIFTRFTSAGWKRCTKLSTLSYSSSLSTQMLLNAEVSWSRSMRSTTLRS